MKLKNLLSALFAGTVAISMMAFASFADETSDTEPVEVDPDEVTEEIIEDETTEEIVEDVTTVEETEVTTEENWDTPPVTAEETTAPAAGDTSAAGNPKTGVAIALIPALAAVAAVVVSRKRK
jgi:hypothetical protein